MALQIEYEQEALDDIVAAGSHAYEEFGEETADRLLARVRELAELIATQPKMAKRIDIPTHRRLGQFQFFPLGKFPYLLFFTTDESTLRVYGLVYESMDLPAVFRKRWRDEP